MTNSKCHVKGKDKYSDFHDLLKGQNLYAYQVASGELEASEDEVINAKATIMDMSIGWKAAIQSGAQPVIPEQPEPTISFYRDGIIAAAKWVERQREVYDNEHGQHDSDTGSFEFGNDAQRDYSETLAEIAEGIRSLHPASAQPVSEPKPVGYFSYGSECGFDSYKTEKEAIESAEAAIDDYRGDACDGWSEETDSVCWGVILQQATKVGERPRTDDDNGSIAPCIDTVCDYALLPAQESE